MIISVVGNILSGKSTLAKKICALYDFSYVPSKRNELNFLDDFFENIPALFFATQTSFLISKVLEIEEKVSNNQNVIVDRSIFEDINVFAQLWMDNYDIAHRDKILYKQLSDYITRTIPPTDVYIYCKCKSETLEERFKNRPHRSFEEKYPQNYIEQLCQKYDQLKFPKGSIVIEVDCDKIDVRKDDTVIEIMNMLKNHLYEGNKGYQISIFDEDKRLNESYSSIDTHPFIKIVNTLHTEKSFERIFEVKKKTIYLAAPFTEFALEQPKSATDLDCDIETSRDYFILPKKYQNLLVYLKKHLSSNEKYKVILPHKDENNWGKTYITNDQIVSSMIDNLKQSDLIFAIVSNSIGVHMEIAMMAILNKPMVLVVVGDLSNGFYAKGLDGRDNTLIINVKTLDDVRDIIKRQDVLNFINKELNYESYNERYKDSNNEN